MAGSPPVRPSAAPPRPDPLVLGYDFAATVLFSVQGASLAVKAELDLLGVLVVGFATALGGGIIRDVLLGDFPPTALKYKRYVIAAFVGGALVFVVSDLVEEIPADALITLDAAALSPYAVSGARKALDYETNALTAVLLGGVTAVGGGVIRDLLLSRIPIVLMPGIYLYATAVLFGAAVMTIGVRLGYRPALMMVLGAVACFTLRMLAYWQQWELPNLSL